MGNTGRHITAERRGEERHAVHWLTRGEHRRRGDFDLTVTNISRAGFLATAVAGLERGERLLVRLPVVGHLDAFVMWSLGERFGFQFERPLLAGDLEKLLMALRRRDSATGL